MIAEEEEKDNAVRMRTGLSIPLLPEREEDKKLASLLTFQSPDCEFNPLLMNYSVLILSKYQCIYFFYIFILLNFIFLFYFFFNTL